MKRILNIFKRNRTFNEFKARHCGLTGTLDLRSIKFNKNAKIDIVGNPQLKKVILPKSLPKGVTIILN